MKQKILKDLALQAWDFPSFYGENRAAISSSTTLESIFSEPQAMNYSSLFRAQRLGNATSGYFEWEIHYFFYGFSYSMPWYRQSRKEEEKEITQTTEGYLPHTDSDFKRVPSRYQSGHSDFSSIKLSYLALSIFGSISINVARRAMLGIMTGAPNIAKPAGTIIRFNKQRYYCSRQYSYAVVRNQMRMGGSEEGQISITNGQINQEENIERRQIIGSIEATDQMRIIRCPPSAVESFNFPNLSGWTIKRYNGSNKVIRKIENFYGPYHPGLDEFTRLPAYDKAQFTCRQPWFGMPRNQYVFSAYPFTWIRDIDPLARTEYKVYIEEEDGTRQRLISYTLVDGGVALAYDWHVVKLHPNPLTGPYLFATPEEFQAFRTPYYQIQGMRAAKEKEFGSWVAYYGYGWAPEKRPDAEEYNGYCRELLDAFYKIRNNNPEWISTLYFHRRVKKTGGNSYLLEGIAESSYIDLLTQWTDCLYLVKEYIANSDVRLMPRKRYDIVAEWNDGAENMQISDFPIFLRKVNMELIKVN